MKKYRVVVKQIIFGEVEVEANNKTEAKECAIEAYENDEIDWDDTQNLSVSLVEVL